MDEAWLTRHGYNSPKRAKPASKSAPSVMKKDKKR